MPPTDTTTTVELAETGGDVAAALDAAQPGAEILHYLHDDAFLVSRRGDTAVDVHDLEHLTAQPRQARGTVTAITAAGFSLAVAARSEDTTTIYSDPDACTLVAVINDDHAGTPGWRDHRVTLDLRTTPEWDLWTSRQGLGPQARFAETIEDGQAEIVHPRAVELLDLAQTFHASSTAKFRQAGRLADGRTQFVYEEDINAKAGDAGELSIPQTFTVALRPFYGADRYKVTARLRYRLQAGELSIGYVLHRPGDVRRAAFADVVESVTGAVDGVLVVDGTPAPPLR